MVQSEPQTRGSRWSQFVFGCAYLVVMAGMFSSLSGRPFWLMLVAVFIGAAFCTSIVLVWLIRWARKVASRLGQFSIASLLFTMLLVSIYFGIVRWLVVRWDVQRAPLPSEGAWQFVYVAVLCFFLFLVAAPLMLRMAESLVWLAVWIIRRPLVQRWLARSKNL